MSDNTQLPAANGGDTVRTIDRAAPGATPLKTQVVQLDVGGEVSPNDTPESLVSPQNPMPVQDPYSLLIAQSLAQGLALQRLAAQTGPGFYPLDPPGFLLGVQ